MSRKLWCSYLFFLLNLFIFGCTPEEEQVAQREQAIVNGSPVSDGLIDALRIPYFRREEVQLLNAKRIIFTTGRFIIR
jgi:hypothetical protein